MFLLKEGVWHAGYAHFSVFSTETRYLPKAKKQAVYSRDFGTVMKKLSVGPMSMLSVSHRWARFGWELPQPNRDGPHLPISSLDPGRSPPGYHHLPHCGDTHQQEKEVGADVLLQCPEEGEKLSGNQLIILKHWLKMVRDLQASATTSAEAVMTSGLMYSSFPLPCTFN